MKRFKQTLSLGLAGVMMTAAPMTAFAPARSSPAALRSGPDYRTIRSSTMRLQTSIHRIQCDVQKNAIDLKQVPQGLRR